MKKLLIADDSSFLRNILKAYLTKERGESSLSKKYEILETINDKTTLVCFEKEKPDLVLLDIVMGEGGREGIEVLKKIKASDHPAKVCMLTAVGQEEIIKECMTLGADSYITKPFNEKELALLIEKYLA